MKFFNKKVLAAAVVGVLVSGNALAAAEIQTANTVFAREIALPATLTVPTAWTLGYNFNESEVRYACIKLDGATPVSSTVTPVVLDSVGGAVATDMTVGSVNTNGNVAFFTLTAAAGIGPTNGYVVDLSGLQFAVTSYNDNVNATVGLYDNPAAAGACAANSTQLIPGSGDNEDLISFKKSYYFAIDPNKLTASVESDPSYSTFVDTAGMAADVSNGGVIGWLHNLSLTLVSAPGLIADGSRAITLADIFPASSSYSVMGDFTWSASADLTANTGTAGAVAFNTAQDKATSTVDVSAGFDADFTVDSGKLDADGNPIEIPVADYMGSLSVIPNAGYSLRDDGTRSATVPVILTPEYDETLASGDNPVETSKQVDGFAGQIVQDGVRLQAPLTQVPSGWISRMVITNTGNKDRTFFLTVYGEDGNTITQGNLTGYTVKAKSTKVIDDLNTVLQGFTGAPRAAIVATVAGPEKEIKGLYQIVNTTSMSLSNYVMVNQDTGSH